MVGLEFADQHCFKDLDSGWLLKLGHRIHQLNSRLVLRFIFLGIILEFLITNRQENLLQGHVFDRVVFDAIRCEVTIYRSKDFCEVLSKVVTHLVNNLTSLINMLRDGAEHVVMIAVTTVLI